MYAIVGASGFLGSYIIDVILKKTKDNILALDRNIADKGNSNRIEWLTCDIEKNEDLLKLNDKIKQYEPAKIIYLAAYHHPDEVKKNPRIAWNINVTRLSTFLNTIENVHCFFYSSTEMVYGTGTKDTFFKEDAKLTPVNIYGKHKVVAECLTTGYGYNVIRFPFLIGPCLIPGRKHFFDVILETIKEGKPMEMFSDAFKTALDFRTAAETLIELIEHYNENMPKIINIAGDEVLSKYEIGLRIAKKYGYSSDLIVPISMKEDNKIFNEKRADCTLLDNSLVKSILGLNELKLNL